jgi:ferredoxin
MIVAKLKPLEEISSSLSRFKRVLILGCGSCVTVCLSGGDREARALARELGQNKHCLQDPPAFSVNTFLRQCERDLLKAHLEVPEGTDAILSLACGAGVQTVAETFATLPVIPALNTTFLGALDEPGIWREKCQGCGDCILDRTGGICPVSRCAKRILNGPCGGSSGGKCEISRDVECAWQLIVDRMNRLGRLKDYEKITPIKDWSTDRGGGPRSFQRAANEEKRETS